MRHIRKSHNYLIYIFFVALLALIFTMPFWGPKVAGATVTEADNCKLEKYTTFPASASVKGDPNNNKCLMANDPNPESITGSHLTVKVLEATKDWYVTGWAWDYLNHEWVELDYKVIDKQRAPQYVTLIDCPAPYNPIPYDTSSVTPQGENEKTLYQGQEDTPDNMDAGSSDLMVDPKPKSDIFKASEN